MAAATELCDAFYREVRAWASGAPDVVAVALVGSRARGTAGPDSDVDLVLLVEDPGRYWKDSAWAGRFGRVVKSQAEAYGMVTSLRVWYENGLEVEFGFSTRRWIEQPFDEGTRRVIRDGVRILFDREALLSPAVKMIGRD